MKHPLALALALVLAANAPVHAQESGQTDVKTDASIAYSGIFSADSPLPLHYPQFDRIAGLRRRHGRTAEGNRGDRRQLRQTKF